MSVLRLPKRTAGCEDCARLERVARAARGDAANRRRILARHTDDDLTARYTAEFHEFSARADQASTDYLAHHAEAHPIPAVVPSRTDNDQAPSHSEPRRDRGPELFRYALRYTPGTSLARRFPGVARGRFTTRDMADRIRLACPNAEHIEVVDLKEEA